MECFLIYGLCSSADSLWFGQSRCCDVILKEYKGIVSTGWGWVACPLSQTTTFSLTINCPQRRGWGALVTKINCKEVFDGTSYIISCIYPAVSLLQLEILAKRLMDHLVGILAKLILAIGLLLVMDLCTFNLIFDSTTNPQGTKEEEEKEKSCPNLVLASCITWPLPTEDCLCAWTLGPGLDQSLSHPSHNIAYCLPLADSLTNATECMLVDDCAGEMLITIKSNDDAGDS